MHLRLTASTAKDETLRGDRPNPGWTTRLGDLGRALGITAVAAGRILEQLGYRFDKHVTDSAVAAGCGVRRWDGFVIHDDWHLDRAVSAIRSAAQVTGEPAVVDALAAAIANQQARERVAARRRKQEAAEAAHRREEDAVVSGPKVELRAAKKSGLKLPRPKDATCLSFPPGTTPQYVPGTFDCGYAPLLLSSSGLRMEGSCTWLVRAEIRAPAIVLWIAGHGCVAL